MKICPICKKQYDPTVNICPEDNEILEEDLTALVGKTLDGQYLIEKLLGQGGMGAVFRARHTLLGDQVAIKIMPSNISKSADYQRRFLREGKTARQFNHPNVVTVHDLRTTQDGMLYMVLEYVEGYTLSEELKRRRKIFPKEAVEILTPIGEALTMAHSLGIVHRDLKPDNIMIGKAKDGSKVVKLLDLGIAKVKNVDATALTITGQILGTPHYMSPEQWNSDEIDGRADIYSLGIILYELVAGVKPFSGKTIQRLAYEHSVSTPPLLSKVVSGVSEEFSKVVEKAMEKDPDKRPKNCQELFQELKESLKYEVSNNEEIEQCETLITSKAKKTSEFSSNKTQQENQVTLISNTEITQVEKTLNNANTLISEVETTELKGKTNANQIIENFATLNNQINKTLLDKAKNETPNKESLEIRQKTFINNQENIEKQENTKPLFSNDKISEEIKTASSAVAKKNTLIPLSIISVVLIIIITGGIYFWKGQSNPTISSVNSPTPSLSPNPMEQTEILRYWLEFTPFDKKKTDKTLFMADVSNIASNNVFKFHFLPSQSGYLYILGLGENDLLVNFLSNKPAQEATGLKSNKITIGEKITFPSGITPNGEERIVRLREKPGKEIYTVIFSPKQLTSLSFLDKEPGYELSVKELAQWEQFRATAKLAKVNFETGNQELASLAKVLVSNVKPEEPIIFNITFEHN
ncbi:MAG: protein kinase [Acidobacteria bacterium]|nr:protein kinase [Acidobacteriota bacterium]